MTHPTNRMHIVNGCRSSTASYLKVFHSCGTDAVVEHVAPSTPTHNIYACLPDLM